MTPYERMRRQKAIENALARQQAADLERKAHNNAPDAYCLLHPFWLKTKCPFCKAAAIGVKEIPF